MVFLQGKYKLIIRKYDKKTNKDVLKCTFFFSCGSFWLWFLTCLRSELGSVYRLLHPGTEQAYGFWNEKVNSWITKITLINLKYFCHILLCWHHKHVSIDPAKCVIDSWHTNVTVRMFFFLPLMKYCMVSVFFCWYLCSSWNKSVTTEKFATHIDMFPTEQT